VQDRTSRPRTSPRQTSVELAQQIVTARIAEHVGVGELSGLLVVPASTTGRCCVVRACRTWPMSTG